MKKDKFILNILGTDSEKEEYEHIQSWIEEEKLAAQDLIAMTQVWSDSDELKDYQSFDTDAALAKTMEKIEAKGSTPKSEAKSFSLPIIWSAAAVVLLLLGGLIYYTTLNNEAPKSYYAANQNMIERVDGTIISLTNDAELKEWASKNQYSLKGMASFDVTKQEKPLKIEVPQGEITVVGTAFLVNAKNNQTTIDLYEGVVELSNESGVTKRLTEGNRAVISDNDIIITSFVDSNNKVSFVFKNESLAKIINVLESQFKVEINHNLEGQDSSDVNAIFVDETIDQMLNELSLITGVKLSLKK